MDFNPITKDDVKFLKSLLGSDRASTGPSNLNLHSRDESPHDGFPPDIVVWPKSTEEIVSILKMANERMIPVTPWGAGTGLEGNAIPIKGGISLDLNLMDRILNIRAEDFQVDVETGVKYKDMNHQLARSGLFFAPDPGANATIGGMVANNAAGIRTVKYGSTRDNVLKLTVVLPTGEVFHAGSHSRKTSSGYDLVRLITGSEGTLGIVTEITLQLAGIPEEFSAGVATFESVDDATHAVYEIMAHGLMPGALELLDSETIRAMNADGKISMAEKPTLFLEFSGYSKISLEENVNLAKEICDENGCIGFELGVGRDERNRLWEARHEASKSILRRHPGLDVIYIDTAVPLSKFSNLVEYGRKTVDEYQLISYTWGPAGDGNLHMDIFGDMKDKECAKKMTEAHDKVVAYAISVGGTATGEHGIGIGKRKYMIQEHGEGVKVMKRIKNLLDPNGILNPGKILP